MVQILKIKKKAGNKPMAENKTDREVKTENEAKTEETAKTEKIKKKKGGLVSGIIFGLIFLIGLSILLYPTISNQ